MCLLLNLFVLGVNPALMALPSKTVMATLVFAAVLLLVNHTWLMTETELTRARYGMFATPEEWAAAKKQRSDASTRGLDEVERRQNAHRNSTENMVHFALLTVLVAFASPSVPAVLTWIGGYGIARLGYTYSYLSGHDNLRGLFMSLGLLGLFGLASYLVLALLM